MRVLLLGASGLLGEACRGALLGAGHLVTVMSRGRRPIPAHVQQRILVGDRNDPTALATLTDLCFDLTIDCLAYDAKDVRRLFSVPGFHPGRLLMISTGQVYLVAATPNRPFVEADASLPAKPEPERETRAWHNWIYGMGKRAAEAALLQCGQERGVPTLALRLPIVQGEADGQSSQRLWAWIQRLQDGLPILLPEAGSQRLRFVYSGDVAAAVLRLADAWPGVTALNLAQPSEITLAAVVDQVAARLGVVPDLVSVSAETLEREGLLDCATYWGPWCSRPDPSAALALGFVTRDPDAYLDGVVDAHVKSPPAAGHPDYALRPQEVALAAQLRGRDRS